MAAQPVDQPRSQQHGQQEADQRRQRRAERDLSQGRHFRVANRLGPEQGQTVEQAQEHVKSLSRRDGAVAPPRRSVKVSP